MFVASSVRATVVAVLSLLATRQRLSAQFSERGVAGASIAEITQRAGVAQGLVNYHFGGKEQLVIAVIDRWFETVLGFARVEGTPDEMLAAVIDGALTATAYAIPLQRAVLAMQQQPSTHRLPACQGWVSPPVHSKFASQGVEGSPV